MRRSRGAHIRARGGFTLIEVVIAAGLLGVFTVAAARPLQQAVMSATLSGDRAAAVYYAAAGLEWPRGETLAVFNDTSQIGSSNQNNWADPVRGITYKRVMTKVPAQGAVKVGGYDVLWKLESTVSPVLTAALPDADIKRLPTMLRPVKIVTYQTKWLFVGQSGN